MVGCLVVSKMGSYRICTLVNLGMSLNICLFDKQDANSNQVKARPSSSTFYVEF